MAGSGTKVLSRVAQKKVPRVAAVPMVVSFRVPRMIPILFLFRVGCKEETVLGGGGGGKRCLCWLWERK